MLDEYELVFDAAREEIHLDNKKINTSNFGKYTKPYTGKGKIVGGADGEVKLHDAYKEWATERYDAVNDITDIMMNKVGEIKDIKTPDHRKALADALKDENVKYALADGNVKDALKKDTVRMLLKNQDVVAEVQKGQDEQEDTLKWGRDLALDANDDDGVKKAYEKLDNQAAKTGHEASA